MQQPPIEEAGWRWGVEQEGGSVVEGGWHVIRRGCDAMDHGPW
jgi:hypothetical protein